MFIVKNYSYEELIKLILGKKVKFKAHCLYFPNFEVDCKVIKMEFKNNEILFHVITYPKNKQTIIGSNMNKLQFSYI